MKRSTNFNSKRRARRVGSSAAGIAAAVRFVADSPEEQRALLERMGAAVEKRCTCGPNDRCAQCNADG